MSVCNISWWKTVGAYSGYIYNMGFKTPSDKVRKQMLHNYFSGAGNPQEGGAGDIRKQLVTMDIVNIMREWSLKVER